MCKEYANLFLNPKNINNNYETTSTTIACTNC